jgi:hypothetical protein
MTRTQFIRRFDRGLPQALGYTLLALVAIALIYSGSLMADSRPTSTPVVVPQWAVPAFEGEWTANPRECDLPGGISSDCVFMD